MTEFLGKNDLNIAQLFFERTKYSVKAFPRVGQQLYIKPVNNFMFAERLLYGRVNKNHEPIAINESFLREIKSTNSPKTSLSALNFVVDAFEAMVIEMKTQGLVGKLDSNDPYLFELKAFNSFSSSKIMYLNYISSLKEVFIDFYTKGKREEAIISFDTFLPVFLKFIMDAAISLPVTKTSFIASNLCSPMISGLSIDLTDLDPSDDTKKQLILDSPNFPYFVQVAKKYGFYIDKFIPWRITADISNPIMLNYAARYGSQSERAVLSNCYEKIGGNAIFNLQQMALDFYNELATKRPVVRIYDGPRLTTVCRKTISIERMVASYSDKFWVDKYIDLLYIEKRKPLSVGALNQLKKNCDQFLDVISLRYTLSVINDNLRGFDKFEGSYANINTKRINKRDNTSFKPTY